MNFNFKNVAEVVIGATAIGVGGYAVYDGVTGLIGRKEAELIDEISLDEPLTDGPAVDIELMTDEIISHQKAPNGDGPKASNPNERPRDAHGHFIPSGDSDGSKKRDHHKKKNVPATEQTDTKQPEPVQESAQKEPIQYDSVVSNAAN